MIIKATPTGRQFGDKREAENFSAVVEGVKLAGEKFDAWEGPLPDSDPDAAAHKPQYWRMVSINQPRVVRP